MPDTKHVLWKSECGGWVIVASSSLYEAYDADALHDDAPLSIGTSTVEELLKNIKIQDLTLLPRKLPAQSWDMVRTGMLSGVLAIFPYTNWFTVERICARNFRTGGHHRMMRFADLPPVWQGQQANAAKKIIADYPKKCKLCRAPAYLGLNEVIHDPMYKSAATCRGQVDA